MKDFLFIANFKEHSIPLKYYCAALKTNGFKTVICPPFTDLRLFPKKPEKNIVLGAQTVSQFENGSHTGEISATMLDDLGVKYCIIGHSERRNQYHENDADIALRAKLLLSTHITPILCVGEKEVLKLTEATKQILTQLSYLDETSLKKMIIAYEPVWAIGSGKTPTPTYIQKICYKIKSYCGCNTVLYGGSVSGKNCREILELKSVNGLLVGGASLDTVSFNEILSLGGKIK